MGGICMHCPVWIKPSPIAAPGVPDYLVSEINTTTAALLLAAAVVFTGKFATRIHRTISGQPRFTD